MQRHTLGPAVRAIRTAQGVPASVFGPRAGISDSYLVNIEAGRKQPTAHVLEAIARELNVPLDAISISVDTIATLARKHLEPLAVAA